MKVLITAGPTYEPIDPVRFIGNRSSGKMGIALAEAFAASGNEVILIKGPTLLNPTNVEIKQENVNTAAEMFEACLKYFQQSDVIVFAAAVADYTPKHVSITKIKKHDAEMNLELVKTKDIAFELGKLKAKKQITVGFALETDNEFENAQQKLSKKNFDFIVLNSMRDEGAGFQNDTNKVTILDKSGKIIYFDLKSKTAVAQDIVQHVLKNINEKI
jgi:phosphopantothenoylcysteine decarboxylase/phosphopantothenate--cysteine ligase